MHMNLYKPTAYIRFYTVYYEELGKVLTIRYKPSNEAANK